MAASDDLETMRADVCIVGAGIAGVNALHVASRYLGPDQHVVLVDRNERVGGMWVDTYDYVRLHQPHPFFTAGDVQWTIGKPPQHLASKTEVLGHLRHCVDEASKAVRLTELLGHEFLTADEHEDGVTVTCRASEGGTVQIVADRVINAVGLSIEANEPLPLSSGRVRSVSPETCDLRGGPIAEDDAPVWVIGSGKTGMDALHTLVSHHPGRRVNLVAGTGTFFVDRDLFYPTGLSRWWRGRRPNGFLIELADRFDGTNEADVWAWARDNYGTWATPTAEHCFIGIMSSSETEKIRDGLGEVVMDHLVDAVDVEDAVRLELRTGGHVDIEPGSWIVNCTSHFDFSAREAEPPYVSASGRVVNIGVTGMFGFTSFAGYFLTHLLFQDKLLTVPLYTTDGPALFRANPSAALMAAFTMSQYNLGLAFDELPAKVFQQCRLDFDRWYPPPRRLAGQIRFMVRHKRQREHYRRTLGTIAERFGVPCGPIVSSSGVREALA